MRAKLCLAAVGAVLAGIASPVVAHADEQNYLDMLNAVGITSDQGSAYLLKVGYLVCNALREGHDPDAIAATIAKSAAETITYRGAVQITNFAGANLCPGDPIPWPMASVG